MIQILLHGMKMDPLVSLHYYAPVCAVINACIIPFTDGLEPLWNLHKVGILVLFTNAGIAFALNVRLFFFVFFTPKRKNSLTLQKLGGSRIPHLCRLRPHPHSCRCVERYPPHLRFGAGFRIAHHAIAGVWVFYQFERVGLVQDYWRQVKKKCSKCSKCSRVGIERVWKGRGKASSCDGTYLEVVLYRGRKARISGVNR